jgi:telomerase reverse transcriptase
LNFLQSEAEEILRQRQLGFSFVRWLPKETGVRPIVNLRRRAGSKVCFPNKIRRCFLLIYAQDRYAKQALSINQALKTAFAILTYEKVRRLVQTDWRRLICGS